eukprot:CAMPEP_0182905718 /NCGR_PEP_ID=MMETSP0034_2-20130328/33164_1 /TAXON_ID=156128 /ORGANISM="Nephroselmis pyriformis, Strain CCMP717" /LENGTH=45 /DNA_ID= /DNA_START= /DNA_END= /DNA_ORIENTATION=
MTGRRSEMAASTELKNAISPRLWDILQYNAVSCNRPEAMRARATS